MHQKLAIYQATQLTVQNIPRGWVQQNGIIIQKRARNEKAFIITAPVPR
ncbi:hypothetical protein NIES4074_45240 [Cylindrospermum sp. NIES-4074]|nr:hypothetical protein NIES4074_45240 [Cylindrospermum sp. NIES-4074]